MDEFKELSLLLGPLTLPLETGEILLAGGGDDVVCLLHILHMDPERKII